MCIWKNSLLLNIWHENRVKTNFKLSVIFFRDARRLVVQLKCSNDCFKNRTIDSNNTHPPDAWLNTCICTHSNTCSTTLTIVSTKNYALCFLIIDTPLSFSSCCQSLFSIFLLFYQHTANDWRGSHGTDTWFDI